MALDLIEWSGNGGNDSMSTVVTKINDTITEVNGIAFAFENDVNNVFATTLSDNGGFTVHGVNAIKNNKVVTLQIDLSINVASTGDEWYDEIQLQPAWKPDPATTPTMFTQFIYTNIDSIDVGNTFQYGITDNNDAPYGINGFYMYDSGAGYATNYGGSKHINLTLVYKLP